LIESALALASKLGYGLSVCDLLTKRGLVFVALNTADRAGEMEAALQAFEDALENSVAGEQAAHILMLRGLAYGERVIGDPAENSDRSIASLREGLKQLEESENDELRAMIQTNMAMALIRTNREPIAAAREAARLCRAALSVRSPQRNADDWAYTQINLGYALLRAAELQDGNHEDARIAFRDVLREAHSITDRSLLGSAHHALGRLELEAGSYSAEERALAYASGKLGELPDEAAAARAAREHLRAARSLLSNGTDPLRYATVLNDLSRALAKLDEDDEALAVAKDGLSLVTPYSAPVTCKALGWLVAAILAERKDWVGAASAYTAAVTAGQLTLTLGSTPERVLRTSGVLAICTVGPRTPSHEQAMLAVPP